MDRFDGIFESLRGFIGAFIGIFLVGGVILGIVLIIRNSKKPKYDNKDLEPSEKATRNAILKGRLK